MNATAQATTEQPRESHAMRCMEIWGGNRAAWDAISTPGIDAWVFSEPHEGSERGGDVHYVSACLSGNIARFALADVSGHGEAVAEFAQDLRAMMRRHINTPDQTRFARQLNKAFGELSDEGKFATAVLSSYFAPTDQLIICNAGHPRPLWWRAPKQEWTALHRDSEAALRSEPSNLPLGIIEPTEYHQIAVKLGVNDLVLLYSDSLTEAQSPEGRMLGEEGVLDILRDLDPSHPETLVKSLLERVRAWRGGAASDDDVTVMLLHHNGADPPTQSVGERLTAIGRLLGLIST